MQEIPPKASSQKLVMGIVVGIIIGIAIGLPVGIIVSRGPSAQPTGPSTYTLTIYTMSSTNQPIPGVTISIGVNQTATGDDGSSTLTLQGGTYNWLATKPGYSDKSGALNINSNYTLTITMTPLPLWHYTISFNGQGDFITDDFAIQGEKFRLNWTASRIDPSAIFTIWVWEGDDPIEIKSIGGAHPWEGEGVFNIHHGLGEFYIKIMTYKLENWTITVEDYY